MDARALARWAGCAVVVVALVVGTACTPKPKPQQPIVLGRPECPQDSLLIQVVDTVEKAEVVRSITTIPVAGPITNIPEFHDCQRFIMGTGNDTYGPLVAIFANHLLDSLYPAQFDSTAAPVGEAAAEIYSYDGAYDPLFIRQGFNCLYLNQTPTGWDAVISWVGSDESGCLEPPKNGEQLAVIPKKPMKDGKDYPAVARWDWDPVNHRQYISIRCGEEWCEVGHAGFATSKVLSGGLPNDPVPSLGTALPNERARVVLIKGWYDEQYLAEGASGGLKPSALRGTAYPHPMLDRMKSEADFMGGWKPVAYVLLDQNSGPYQSKLNLEQGLNRIFYCHGAFSDCQSDQPTPACPSAADHQWWAKIVPDGSQHAEYRCVTRRTHPNGDEIPGAVRWRWDENDEKLWVRCPQGCCTVS
jgi:hypothetical protein